MVEKAKPMDADEAMNASREAFDLFNPSCRRNFRFRIRRHWKYIWWWRLVISDTFHRVCSRSKP